MRLPSPQAALTIAVVAFAAIWALVLGDWHLNGRASVLDRLEAPLLDLRFLAAGTQPAPDDVTIVAIDDAAARDEGGFPLPRTAMARLIREIDRGGPLTLAIDVLFLDPGDPAADRDLADAVGEARAIVAGAALFPRKDIPLTPTTSMEVPAAERIRWPIRPLRRVAGIGLVNVTTDHAGTPRHVPLLIRGEEALHPSFPLRTAVAAAGADPEIEPDRVKLGLVVTMIDLGGHLPLRFYGPRGAIRTVSAADVLRGTIAPDEFRDRIVIVGATALGAGDTFATPYDAVFPGVEVLATAVSHLMNGDGLKRTPATRRLDAAVALVLAVTAVGLIAWRRTTGFVLAIVLAAGWLVLTAFAFAGGYWLSATVPLAAAAPAAIVYVAGRLWLDQRTERQLATTQAAFRRFHPPALADRLAATPDFLAEPIEQNAAVLFVDLSGFTGLSERLGPERTRSLLKEFHSLVESTITDHGGLVTSYMGDGAMIVFGLPTERPNDPAHALGAAKDLVEDVGRWLAERLPEAGVRVGGHYGRVVLSRLGADTHEHITATGDCVNVASRLLEVAAANGAELVVSADLFDAARARSPVAERLAFGDEREIAIRGRAKPLVVRLWRSRAELV